MLQDTGPGDSVSHTSIPIRSFNFNKLLLFSNNKYLNSKFPALSMSQSPWAWNISAEGKDEERTPPSPAALDPEALAPAGSTPQILLRGELPWLGFKAGLKACAVSRAGDMSHFIPAGQELAPPAAAPSVRAATPPPWAAPRGVTAAGRRGQGGKAALSPWRAGDGSFPGGEV